LFAARFSAFGSTGTAKSAAGLVLFAAPDGNDSWSGRLAEPNAARTDGPLASLAGARDRIRALRKAGTVPEGPVEVVFADGIYRIKETIVFTAEDSGTKEFPVTYRAASGAKPVISGGRLIGLFRPSARAAVTVEIPGVRLTTPVTPAPGIPTRKTSGFDSKRRCRPGSSRPCSAKATSVSGDAATKWRSC